MATPPKLPSLNPSDMAWARWVTRELAHSRAEVDKLHGRVTASNQQRTAMSSKTASNSGTLLALDPILPTLPDAAPLTPTAPTLTTDHATVTIRWDGNVTTAGGAKLPPGNGFKNVVLERLDPLDSSATWTRIGSVMGVAGVMVDVNVVVGNQYYYRLTTIDTLGTLSTPSASASITVVGVDLGSLDDDVKQTLDDIQLSATTGGLVYYGTTPPTDPKYQRANSLWFDTSPTDGAIAKRWDSTTSTWAAVPFGSGALGEGSVVASKILAGSIDTYHLGAGIITTEKLEAGAITTEKLGVDAVTANNIAVGAIDADRLAVGAVTAKTLNVTAYPPQATPTNRVPRPVNDADYWNSVISGEIDLGAGNALVDATTSGIVLTPTTAQAFIYVTARVPVPASGKLFLSGSASGPAQFYVKAFTDVNDTVGVIQPGVDLVTDGSTFTLPANAAYYQVKIAEGAGGNSTTVSSASVFEVISTSPTQERSELSPSGLRLYNDTGELSVDLSTSTANFVSIYNNGQSLATIDEAGDGNFQTVQANEVNVGGNDLVGAFADYQRMDGTLDGALLARLPRGVMYAANWASMQGYTVNTQYQRIATGSFNLPADRQYMLMTDLGGLQATIPSGVNVYIELQLSMTPMNAVNDGTVFQRAVIYNGQSGYWALAPITFRTRDWQVDYGVDPVSNIIPSNVDIYWQINTNMSTTPTSSYTLSQFSGSTGLTIMDIGPVIKPLIATDHTTSGAPATGGAGTGTGGSSTSKTVTKTFAASWSASWNSGGSSKVTGTGTYTDGNMLYQGLGASAMGSKIGFPSLTSTLSGKTINKVELYLQNRWTYANAGGTAHLAGHTNTTEPATYGSNVTGTGFTEDFSRGQGKWFTISDSEIPYASWKSGAVRGIALTVQGSDSAYQYYDGVGKSRPPQLRITYTT